MTLTIDTAKATMILVAGHGWQNITAGTLKIDQLELIPSGNTSEAEDYGFSATTDSATIITGRLSALLAVQQNTR